MTSSGWLISIGTAGLFIRFCPSLIYDKDLCAVRRIYLVRIQLVIVDDKILILLEIIFFPISHFDTHFPFEKKNVVAFLAPMIGFVTGRIFDRSRMTKETVLLFT